MSTGGCRLDPKEISGHSAKSNLLRGRGFKEATRMTILLSELGSREWPGQSRDRKERGLDTYDPGRRVTSFLLVNVPELSMAGKSLLS